MNFELGCGWANGWTGWWKGAPESSLWELFRPSIFIIFMNYFAFAFLVTNTQTTTTEDFLAFTVVVGSVLWIREEGEGVGCAPPKTIKHASQSNATFSAPNSCNSGDMSVGSVGGALKRGGWWYLGQNITKRTHQPVTQSLTHSGTNEISREWWSLMRIVKN